MVDLPGSLTGTNNPNKQASVNWGNLVVDALAGLVGNAPVNPVAYGLVEGDSPSNGAANSAALSALLADLRAEASNVTTFNQGLRGVSFPPGTYWFDSTLEITDGSLVISGAGGAGYREGNVTVLRFPAGVTGIRVQRYNTEGSSGTRSPTGRGGDGTVIQSLQMVGGYAGTEGDFHGIELRARASIRNVYITGFEGAGIHGHATAGGSPEGNANNSRIIDTTLRSCRDGIFIDGADANIWTLIGVDYSFNRRWGRYDSSFLGNSEFAGHAAANGLVSGTIPTVVTNSGNRYGVIVGQEVGASTNSPSGTTADNTWWYYIAAGGESASNNINEWASGTTYRAGGSWHTDNSNARNWIGGSYHEGGQGKAQLTAPTKVEGGLLSDNVYGTAISPTISSAGTWSVRNLRATNNSGPTTGGIGYGTGAGGTVTQATSKTTSVALNAFSGTITTHGASIAANSAANFVFTNTRIASGDVVDVSLASGGTAGAYVVSVYQVSASQCRISIRNMTGGALAETLVLNFAVIKGATS